MKIQGNWPIFYLWPIQKLLHFGIPDRVQSNVPTRQAILAIYGGSALYMVVMQWVGQFPGKSTIGLYESV